MIVNPSPPFAVEHVLPIMRDEKTQTRRVVWPQSSYASADWKPKHGPVGTRWYLREALARHDGESGRWILYAADHAFAKNDAGQALLGVWGSNGKHL